MCTFKVGDHVEEWDECGFSKIVKIEGNRYLVRQFAHPHKLCWTDEHHLSPPLFMRHDPKAYKGEKLCGTEKDIFG